jgi:hypothetical protein
LVDFFLCPLYRAECSCMSMHCLYFLMHSHLSVLCTCIDSMSILSIFPNMFQYCMNFVIWRIVLGIQLLGEQFVNILHRTNLAHSAFGLLSLNMEQFMFLVLDPIQILSRCICYRVSET